MTYQAKTHSMIDSSFERLIAEYFFWGGDGLMVGDIGPLLRRFFIRAGIYPEYLTIYSPKWDKMWTEKVSGGRTNTTGQIWNI